MLSNNEQRHGQVAASAPDACIQFKIKRANGSRPRRKLEKIEVFEDDEEVLHLERAKPASTTDIVVCFRCCKFKKIGQNYVSAQCV